MPPRASRSSFAYEAALPVAALLALVSAGGLLLPDAYARETPAWTAQAVGQDWFDLVVAAPWLAWCGLRARRGSRTWRVLLAGAYAYTVYEMCIYAFAVHWNALFLLYCATLGASGYALVDLAIDLAREVPPPVGGRGARIAGGFLVVIGVAFAALWLAEDVPALVRAEPPPSLAETGLLTNPVHVIDYAFVLPAHVIAGLALWRGRRSGALLAPVVLAFGVLMAASIGGMLLVIALSGGVAPWPVMAAMFLIAATTGAMLRIVTPPSAPE